jgi:hypothetical protein
VSDDGWYRALTEGPARKGPLIAPEPTFYGDWTEARWQAEIGRALQVRHRLDLFSGQRARCRPCPRASRRPNFIL